MGMLELRGIDKVYRSRGKPAVHAVRALDMDIRKGEIVALLGSSGCGKTSTLRMIAGFEDVTSGLITLNGRRIDHLPPAQRRVAMAFEGYSLYPPLTVRENIAFALKSRQLPRADVTRRVEAIAQLVEIEDILESFPRSISGGQQQRASLARALVRDADLYLLDEPMGQLEPQLRAVLRGRIKSLLAEREMTAIFVTHDQTEASALADRIAVMEDGVLQQFGSEKQLKDTGLQPIFPVWGMPTRDLAKAMIVSGTRAKLTCVDTEKLDRSFVGREFDQALLADLPEGVDPCGERGEFHSFVYAGPMLGAEVAVSVGEIVVRDQFVFADLRAA